MHKLGTTKPFSLKMEGIAKQFTVTAIVIAELADDVNAGSAFLQWIGRDTGKNPNLTFHGKGVSLQIGRDRTELINSVQEDGSGLGPDPQREQTQEPSRTSSRESSIGQRQLHIPICAKENLRLQPNTLNFIGTPPIKGTVLCEPVATDQECRALPAIYRATQKVALINLSEKVKLIPKGTQIAKVTLLRKPMAEEPELTPMSSDAEITELFEKLSYFCI